MIITLIIILKYVLSELFILFLIRLSIIDYIEKQKYLKTKYYKTAFKDYNIVGISEFLLLNNNDKLIENIPNDFIDNPFFSIIIPCLNCYKTLKKTIRSIQNQIYKNYEIILVDDLSSDNSMKIANDLSKIDKRIKIIKNEEKSGQLFSRLKGCEYSKGKLIYFLDCDDMLALPNVLDKIYNLSKKYNADTIEFNSIRGKIKKYSRIIEMANSKNDYKKIIYGKDIINTRYIANKKIKRNIYGAMWTKVVKKKIIDEIISFYNGTIGINSIKNWNYAEDQHFTDLLRIYSKTYLHVDKIYHFYYENQKSLTFINDKKNIFTAHYKYIYYFNILLKKFNLNIDYLICNVMTFFAFKYTKTNIECLQFYKLIKDIKINMKNITNYGNITLDKIIKNYHFYCDHYY